MKKLVLCLLMVICLFGCSSKNEDVEQEGETVYKIGICNYVDDASLNQIVANIKSELSVIESENNVSFEILEDNANADAVVLDQIVSNFIMEDVDLMVGIATPVAMVMQAKTEDNNIPVVFAAVSDPVGAELVDSMENPGSNLTGTSDYLDTKAVFSLMFALDDVDTVGLLYDVGQDASTSAIKAAKEFLNDKGVAYKEYTGTNTSEVMLAVESMISDGVKFAFTPTDNTIMTAELSIYESMAKAGIKHYTGADYANLGKETARMVKDVLIDGKDPAALAVKTFDNGIATVNSEICEELGISFDDVKAVFEPLCTQVNSIETAESFK